MTPINEHGAKRLPAERYDDLDQELREFLEDLRPEEIEAMRRVARLGDEGSQKLIEAVKLAQSVMTVGRFVRWTVIGMIGFFVAFSAIASWIMDVWHKVSPGGLPK